MRYDVSMATKKRDATITVRMLGRERSEINNAARRSGSTIASWIRMVLLREAREPRVDRRASPESEMRAEAIEESGRAAKGNGR